MSELFKNPFFKGQNLKKKVNRTQNDSDFAIEDELDNSSSSSSDPPLSEELTDSISEKSFENVDCGPSPKRRKKLNKTSKPKKSVKSRYYSHSQYENYGIYCHNFLTKKFRESNTFTSTPFGNEDYKLIKIFTEN